MNALGVILARAGSKGLPGKCLRHLLGRPVIAYTCDHANSSRRLTGVVLTTDCEEAKAQARQAGIEVIDRPAELATDTATVEAAVRHAVTTWESRHGLTADVVVLLYGNVPVRAAGLIDRAIDQLLHTGADSVRSVAPVGKHHPDWLHHVDVDRMSQFRPNSIGRRQDLEPLYYHDGAVVAVTRKALFQAIDTPGDSQAFLGRDRRALIQRPEDAVDIDEPIDLCVAEALVRANGMASQEAPASAGATPGVPGVPRADDETDSGTENGQGTPKDQESSPPPLKRWGTRSLTVAARLSPAGAELVIPPVAIGDLLIGQDRPVFVVAEAGVNHNGSVDTALRMVDAAAEAGADAVKFQMFCARDLATAAAGTAAYQRNGCGDANQRAMLERLELSADDFGRIKEHCEDRSILFLCTPFGPPEVDRLVELGVGAIKIASTDLTNGPLLDRAAASGLPIILSTGASTLDEIDQQVQRLRRCGVAGRLILLHCVSCYPTPPDVLNLRAIGALTRAYQVPCGLSDHTASVDVGAWAVAAGACILEKHFTLDREMSGPDHAMSLTPNELAGYIAAVHSAESALGNGVLGMTQREAEVRAAAGKSIVSATAIAAGTRVTREMLTVKRPGTGIPAGELDVVVGRVACVDIPVDTTLSWDLVE